MLHEPRRRGSWLIYDVRRNRYRMHSRNESVELAVRKLAIICLFIVGVSHIAQPRAWVQFFLDLHGKGEVGSFYNALINLPLGAFIVSFHNVWRGLPSVLTLLGWA